MSHLEGKIAVITGGSSGIGLATAKRFVEEGAYVFITGRRQLELDRARVEIGKNVTTIQGDVANLADLDRLYATIKAEKGTIDIVVANAGFIEHAKIFDLSEAHYDKTMDINLKGVVFTVQKALPLMTRGGSIVVVSSIINVKGVPAHGTYAAAKAGVRALVRVWAQELKDKGVRVNTLSPGATETPIIRGQFDSDEAADAAKNIFASMTPLGRIGLPARRLNASSTGTEDATAEIVLFIVWKASNMSAYFVMIREKTTDATSLAEYGPRASLAAQHHPLKPLAIYGALDQLEGDAVEGAVIIEFPDMAAARAWYDSPAYQAAVKFRHAGSKSKAFFIEGV